MNNDSFSLRAKGNEEAWVAQHEKELLERLRKDRENKMAEATQKKGEEELVAIRETHWHKCPKCGHDMTESEMESISTLQCSFCDGIFFEHAELQELLEFHHEQKRGIFKHLIGLGRK
jgi:acetyl-CoA carboxylase beta subunit